MDENEIIDFINQKYSEWNNPVKSLVGSLVKRQIGTLQIDDWPISLRSCTIEQLITTLKKANLQGRLKF